MVRVPLKHFLFSALSVLPLSSPVKRIVFFRADNLSSLTALQTALDDLDTLYESIEDAYRASLEQDHYEKFIEQS